MADSIRRSIDQKRPPRWRARYLNPNTGKWVGKDGFAKKSDAQDWLDEQIAAIKSKVIVPSEKHGVTFEKFAEVTFWPEEEITLKTEDQQLRLYRLYVLEKWAEWPLIEITLDDIEAWITELKRMPGVRSGKPLSAQTIHHIWGVFRKIMVRAVEKRFVPASPLPLKPKLPEIVSAKGLALEPEQVAALAAECGEYELLIYLMAYGGFRPGEAFALRVDDFLWRQKAITVDETVINVNGETSFSERLKTLGARRTVPLPDSVFEMVARYVTSKFPPNPLGSTLMFTAPEGGAIELHNWRRRVFAKGVKSAGLPKMKPYDLRHTAASAWFDEGADYDRVAQYLGDSVRTVEKTYVHMFANRRPELMGKLDERIERGRKAASGE